MKIVLDIDGTISANPQYVTVFFPCTYTQGGSVIIISSRSENDEVRGITTDQLAAWSIRYDRLYFFKLFEEVENLSPHAELDRYQKYLW